MVVLARVRVVRLTASKQLENMFEDVLTDIRLRWIVLIIGRLQGEEIIRVKR